MVSIVILSGCAGEYSSKATYFDGSVVVEYNQTKLRGSNDYLNFRFYEKGVYEVVFSSVPGKSTRGQDKMPANFTRIIEATPREVVARNHMTSHKSGKTLIS